jgi:hypothetical protein
MKSCLGVMSVAGGRNGSLMTLVQLRIESKAASTGTSLC